MNVLSLFDGMASGRRALGQAGIKVDRYISSEVDKYAMQVANGNYPDVEQVGDILELRSSSLPRIDLLIGGSPCQGFSFAGKRLNFDDPRSKLFFEFVRLKDDCRPRWFLLENVKMKKGWRDIITEYLGVEPILIDSALVSAQHRERYYWTNIPGVTQPEDRGQILADVLEPGVDERFFLSDKRVRLVESGKKYGVTNKVCDPRGKSFTLSASMGMGGGYEPKVWDRGRLRKLTPLECERLQTLPDGYTAGVSNSQRYKMIGNGWTIEVLSHIFSNLRHLVCQWCGAPGKAIGTSYGSLVVYHCTECHHEWEA